ncbi:hypothetical protein [Bacteriovorax sp. BSW11_IV]|uniref:hypothetical protein n=1 Tax=Bacteriovorax sp. BSW11_IV TaxID=1353529 RepID=UPI0006970F13
MNKGLKVEKDFWIEAWDKGMTGFHQSAPNKVLTTIGPKIFNKTKNVFVPLCGKSLDMLWLLENGHNVIGVEIAEKAVEDFFIENSLSFEIEKNEKFSIYRSKNIALYLGSFFDLTKEDLGKFDVYDRASIVALPKEMRQKYAQHLCNLSSGDTKILMQTYEQTQVPDVGPPFSILEDEIMNLFENHYSIEILNRGDSVVPKRHQNAGATKTQFVVYHLAQK